MKPPRAKPTLFDIELPDGRRVVKRSFTFAEPFGVAVCYLVEGTWSVSHVCRKDTPGLPPESPTCRHMLAECYP